MHDLIHFVQQHPEWAYLVLFLWTIIEGETIVLVCGAMASARHSGQPGLSVPLIALAALVGSMSGDNLWFFLGRYKGKAFLAKRPRWQVQAAKVYRIFERHQDWLMIGFRFIYGLRNVTPFALGISNVRAKKFLICNFIGATVWAISFTLAGYFLGSLADEYLKHYKWHVLAGVCLAGLAVWLIRVALRAVKVETSVPAVIVPPELDPQIHPEPELEK